MKDNRGILLATGVAAGVTAAYLLWRSQRDKTKWVEVATVDKLYLHPVKGCRGIRVDSFEPGKLGIMMSGTEIGDRTFMIVVRNGEWARQSQFNRTVLIRPTVIGKDRLKLEAPDMDSIEIQIPQHGKEKVSSFKIFEASCPGVDCGEDVAGWLQKFLGEPDARLIFHNKQLPHRERNKLLEFSHLGVYADAPMKSIFQNFSPFNMVSQASLDVLNSKLDADHQVTERNFRPNVVLKDCSAFAEDNWKRVRIGSAEFVFAKLCSRCPSTTVNPETGIKNDNRDPLTTLLTFRRCKPEEKGLYRDLAQFSVDYANVKEGKMSVGDKVYCAY